MKQGEVGKRIRFIPAITDVAHKEQVVQLWYSDVPQSTNPLSMALLLREH